MSASTHPPATRGRDSIPAPALRVRRLSGRDKVVLSVMVGIPTLIQLVLVWIPTLMSVGLSFTRWNGLELTDLKPAGVENYQFVSQDYPPFWPAVQHNVLWLVFLALVATPLGLLLGANAVPTFFRVVFPAMRPVNVIIIVITVIESLRAFEIVYVINRGTNGLELISALVIQNLVGEGQVIGVGSALAVILLVISLVPITFYLSRAFGKDKEA